MAAPSEPTLTELTERLDWQEHRLRKVEDRVDRLYAQSRVFTIHSEALDKKWKDLGDVAGPGQMAAQGGGEVWLEEVCKALGVQWPLSRDEPGREDMIHGRRARDVHNALWAFSEEISAQNLVRIEAEWGGENWTTRKEKQFTMVYRLGDSADRLERHLSSTLNHVLTQANRAAGGNQVLAWRAKTKGEKRKRAWERRAKEEQADDPMGDEAQAAGQGKAKGKNNKGKGGGKGNKGGKGKGKGKPGRGRGRGR